MVSTRQRNKDVHPGLPVLNARQTQRSSAQVQDERRHQEEEQAATESSHRQMAKRLAELEQRILQYQTAEKHDDNHSLNPETIEIAKKTPKKSSSAKAKSVNTHHGNKEIDTTVAIPAELMDVGGDTEIDTDVAVAQAKPAPKKRSKKVTKVTRADIEESKAPVVNKETTTKALQVLGRAGVMSYRDAVLAGTIT